MHTVQEIKDLIAAYKKEHPELKSQVSIEALEAMEALHGSGAIDECYGVIVKQFEGEIEVLELVKLGVPYADAVMQVYTQTGIGDGAQV